MAIFLPYEKQFAYARSADWCNWEDLGPILSERRPGEADEQSIWSPFVLEEGGTYYAYYTGVTRDFTQRILLATTQNPADPASWQERGVIFHPDHLQAKWTAGEWADCRDPMVLKAGELYYLYYSGRDSGTEGDYGIVGLATAASPEGPWTDQGAILALSTPANYHMLESPTVYPYQGNYYLFANNTSCGEEYRVGSSPSGPWSNPRPFQPGWAHEVWSTTEGLTYSSYLTDYTVSFSPVSWSFFAQPSRPVIGEQFQVNFAPMLWSYP
jgi:beta-xylosidase